MPTVHRWKCSENPESHIFDEYGDGYCHIGNPFHGYLLPLDDRPLPLILEFKSSAAKVKPGQPFTLSWQVNQTTQLVLFRNEISFKNLETGQNQITLQEEATGNIQYVLQASNQHGQTRSQQINITVKEEVIVLTEPIIHAFNTNKSEVKTGETFELSWQVAHAANLFLYRNGNREQEIPIANSRLVRQVPKDEKFNTIEYKLQAINEAYEVDSSPLIINIIKEAPAPGILLFTSINSTVKTGEKVRLRWHANNATYFKLKRNGVVLQELGAKETAVDIAEAFGAGEKEVIYSLVAGNNTGEQESEPLIIPVEQPMGSSKTSKNLTIKLTLLVMVAALTGILLVAFKAFYPTVKNNKKGFLVHQLTPIPNFAEGKNVVITGEKFPTEVSAIQILFNAVPGKIIKNTSDSLVVQVPQLGKNLKNGQVNVALVWETDTLKTWNAKFGRSVRSEKSMVAEGSTFKIFGNYFPADAATIRVIFNQVASPTVKPVNDTTLGVLVPFLNGNVNKVKVGLVIQDDTTYAPEELFIRRINLAQTVAAEGESLVITGTSFPGNLNLVKVFFDLVPGRITRLAAKNLQVKVPKIRDLPLNKEVTVSVLIAGDTILAPEKLTIKTSAKPPIPRPTDNSLAAFIKNNLKVVSNIPRGRIMGDFDNLQITVTNNSMFDVEVVFVQITYKKDGQELKKVYNLPRVLAHSSTSKEVTIRDFGSAAEIKDISMVESNIINIISTQRDNHVNR